MGIRTPLLLAYVTFAALCLTGVLLRGAATADGLFLGLPAGLAWVTGWSALTFVVLAVYDATGKGEEDEGA